jgi:hypothetical protein
MARLQPRFVRSVPLLLLIGGWLAGAVPEAASAGPLVRRAQERKACQEFATKLQAAGGNTPAAQQVYQQGVLQLVARFGENPCTDIPAPTASGAPAPAAAAPATPTPASAPAAPAANPQQQQACQQFAGKIQSAAASGGTAAAQQTYTMGLQKLTGMFGSNPCPTVKPPQ